MSLKLTTATATYTEYELLTGLRQTNDAGSTGLWWARALATNAVGTGGESDDVPSIYLRCRGRSVLCAFGKSVKARLPLYV
jgi:hypothetical protein